MQIGKPQRIYVIEPLENPVPSVPVEKPAEKPKPRPVEPKTRP
jgi:hypothetical protein